MFKLAKDLKLNDEFMILHDRSAKRCFVASTPVIDGNIIKFKIHPCCKRWIKSKLRLIKFALTTQIEVFDIRANQAVDMRRLYQQDILQLLTLKSQTTAEIKELIALKHGKINGESFRLALRGLAITKRVISKLAFKRGVRNAGNCYRLPLSTATKPHLFVIEERGRSQRVGWIEEWKEHAATGNLQPIVRFLQPNGTTAISFSKDEFLEVLPISNQFLYKQVELAKKRHEGQCDRPPIEIPYDMLRRLYESSVHTYKADSPAMNAHRKVLLEIAKHLGWVDEYREICANSVAAKTLDCVWTHYPGWRSGRFAA